MQTIETHSAPPLSFKCKIVTAVLCSRFDIPSGNGILYKCLAATLPFHINFLA